MAAVTKPRRLAASWGVGFTIITTNRAYKDWATTAAVLDRVVHHCHTVRTTGDSYRQNKAISQSD
jgi:DNA replication protein DnaC